jgi:hypothetical protein
MQILIEISEESYNKLTQKSMLMSASAIDEAVDAVKKGKEFKGWVPIKLRELTKDEKPIYKNMPYVSETMIYDCPLPEDGQDVLITTNRGEVVHDYFVSDVVDGCFFENWYDVGDVVAWMPLPEPYKVVNEVDV